MALSSPQKSPSYTSGSTLIGKPESKRCNFQARLIYTSQGFRGIQEFTVDIVEIAPVHLVLKSKFASYFPDNFTLSLGLRQHGIGCAAYARKEERVSCHLLRPETAEMVEFLVNVRRPQETLEEINNPLFGRSRVQHGPASR